MQAVEAELLIDAKATLGEGPIWDDQEQRLYWVDIMMYELHWYDPDDGRDRKDQVGQTIGCVVPRAAGGVMVTLKNAFAGFDPMTSNLSNVVKLRDEPETNRFNDGKCDPAGRYWAGTIGPAGTGALYRLDLDLSVHRMIEGVTCSNGLAWNAAKDTFYYIDTPTMQVVAYDYDNDTGAIDNRRVIIEVSDEEGKPDGMTIDAEDKLWIAHWGGSRVVRWDPDNGSVMQRIGVAATHTTACAFGGKNLDQLYITSARTGLDADQLASQPHAGGVFVAAPGVCGVPAFTFKG
ncbi:MAG: SMP-30/gluconolactonase/LRE family protein [Verrucomicrobia bacterium]|nr:SMP-30/gluconolactonase/LRE family protein [Verrucomicrobiota bacterium]